MVMKLNKNVLIILVLTFCILMINCNVYATDSIIQGAEDFLSKGDEDTLNSDKIKEVSDKIYFIFTAIGSAIIVIVGAILGIQFILGSTEEKAKIKEALIPYAIGTIIIYGSWGIWRMMVIAMQEL